MSCLPKHDFFSHCLHISQRIGQNFMQTYEVCRKSCPVLDTDLYMYEIQLFFWGSLYFILYRHLSKEYHHKLWYMWYVSKSVRANCWLTAAINYYYFFFSLPEAKITEVTGTLPYKVLMSILAGLTAVMLSIFVVLVVHLRICSKRGITSKTVTFLTFFD